MCWVTDLSVCVHAFVASFKLIQASSFVVLTEDVFDFVTSNKFCIARDRSRASRSVDSGVYATLDFGGYPRVNIHVQVFVATFATSLHPINIQTDCLIMTYTKHNQHIKTTLARTINTNKISAHNCKKHTQKH